MLEPVLNQAPFDKRKDEENSKADLIECQEIFDSLNKVTGWRRDRCSICGEIRDCIGNLLTRQSICKVCRTLEIFKSKHNGQSPR
jgi:NTP pyrophosphatase (non-canonical NTP hydrolase)